MVRMRMTVEPVAVDTETAEAILVKQAENDRLGLTQEVRLPGVASEEGGVVVSRSVKMQYRVEVVHDLD